MLTIWGVVLAALGILVGVFLPRLVPRLFSGQGVLPNAVGIALVALGAGMQVYDVWSRLPTHCQSVLSLSCPAQAPTAAKSKRR
jgi:hypothetical protein